MCHNNVAGHGQLSPSATNEKRLNYVYQVLVRVVPRRRSIVVLSAIWMASMFVPSLLSEAVKTEVWSSCPSSSFASAPAVAMTTTTLLSKKKIIPRVDARPTRVVF